MSQLPLPIAWPDPGEAGSLLVTAANSAAIALLRDWARWPAPATLLVGPPRSGRSLIGALFARESGGTLVDDAEAADEQRLFHLWNEARDSGRPLLLIARQAPPLWKIGLPDLRTRLATAAIARIEPPDESVTAMLIAHGLEQAGSAFAPDMTDFVAWRVTRCYESIARVTAALNAESLASGRKLSVASARAALERSGLLAADDAAEQEEGPDARG